MILTELCPILSFSTADILFVDKSIMKHKMWIPFYKISFYFVTFYLDLLSFSILTKESVLLPRTN